MDQENETVEPDEYIEPTVYDDRDVFARLRDIENKLDSCLAMLIEFMEFKSETEAAIKDFQPPNIMKLISGLMSGKPPID